MIIYDICVTTTNSYAHPKAMPRGIHQIKILIFFQFLETEAEVACRLHLIYNYTFYTKLITLLLIEFRINL